MNATQSSHSKLASQSSCCTSTQQALVCAARLVALIVNSAVTPCRNDDTVCPDVGCPASRRISCRSVIGQQRVRLVYRLRVCLSPRQVVLCFQRWCLSCPSVRLSVCPSVCPTLIGGGLWQPFLPLSVGRLIRDLGQMTANTSQMCLLGVT